MKTFVARIAVLTLAAAAYAKPCGACGADFPGSVREINFDGWTDGPEPGVEIVGAQVYAVEDGRLVMGDGDGQGEEMRVGFTVDLSDLQAFNVSGKFSITKARGGEYASFMGFGHTSTGSAFKITLLGGSVGYSLWVHVEGEGLLTRAQELIIKEEGFFFKGVYYKGFLEESDFQNDDNILFKGFNLKGYWEDPHDFSFNVSQGNTTMRVDDNSFDLPSLPTADVKLLVSVYDDLIAEVWDLKVEALPE